MAIMPPKLTTPVFIELTLRFIFKLAADQFPRYRDISTVALAYKFQSQSELRVLFETLDQPEANIIIAYHGLDDSLGADKSDISNRYNIPYGKVLGVIEAGYLKLFRRAVYLTTKEQLFYANDKTLVRFEALGLPIGLEDFLAKQEISRIGDLINLSRAQLTRLEKKFKGPLITEINARLWQYGLSLA